MDNSCPINFTMLKIPSLSISTGIENKFHNFLMSSVIIPANFCKQEGTEHKKARHIAFTYCIQLVPGFHKGPEFPIFLAPGTGFMEDSFFTDQGLVGGGVISG